jgi:hypothetical protein
MKKAIIAALILAVTLLMGSCVLILDGRVTITVYDLYNGEDLGGLFDEPIQHGDSEIRFSVYDDYGLLDRETYTINSSTMSWQSGLISADTPVYVDVEIYTDYSLTIPDYELYVADVDNTAIIDGDVRFTYYFDDYDFW